MSRWKNDIDDELPSELIPNRAPADAMGIIYIDLRLSLMLQFIEGTQHEDFLQYV